MVAHRLRICVHTDPVLAPNRNTELERVDRIQSQAVAEQRSLAVDLLDRNVLQVQDLDEKVLELLFHGIHSNESPCLALPNARRSSESAR